MTILVLRALGLGDFLTSLPALRALRRAHPDAQILLGAPPRLEPLVELCGAVDVLVPAEPLRPVHIREPGLAVNLHGRGPESHRVLLATRPTRLIAFANAAVPESTRMPPWNSDEHEVDRWCRLLEAFGIPADRSDLGLQVPPLEPPPAAVRATLIHPGAASAARRWPLERWAQVACAELAAGHRVAISAGPDETLLASELATRIGARSESVVAGDLMTLAAAVAAARVVVCGDTGVAHLATALGTPSIVLFGPTSPDAWGPPSWHPHVALWAGHRGDPHATSPDSGLLAITASQVIDALEALGEGVVPTSPGG